jgi:membrane-bound serine protease (ClpP class)
LAFFALQMLPVNYAGLLLILFGLLLLALEIKVTSYGLLTTGGLVSLTFGSMMLMNSSVPELQLSLRIVLPVVVGFTAVAMFLVRLALASRRQPAVTGAESMIGEGGRASTTIGPEGPGHVVVHGEIWQAKSAESIPEGAHILVTRVDGLTLTVHKD